MSHSDRERVATRLRMELARRQMSGADLARLAGWARATTARRLSGETDIPTSDLLHVARVLDVTVATLIDPEPATEPAPPASAETAAAS